MGDNLGRNDDQDYMPWNIQQDDESFEDSERFEEDSQVSYDDSLDGGNQNWRGWADGFANCEALQPASGLSVVVHQFNGNGSGRFSSASTNTIVHAQPQSIKQFRNDSSIGSLLPLTEIAARICAEKWSFQQLEEMYQYILQKRLEEFGTPILSPTIPEKIFLSFIIHCFPKYTDEVRMYSTLANGKSEQFDFGKQLYEYGNVKDVSQTGFLLSGNVAAPRNKDSRPQHLKDQDSYHVTVKVDRCRIVECSCECSPHSSWCQHVVALCIYRIHEKSKIKFNETIADAINNMNVLDLRKLVQWHLNEIPRKCIPGFQKLLDQVKDPHSEINKLHGAPDPTDGGHETVSRFEFPEIEDKVRRLMCKYCIPSPSVHCDVQYLTNTQPAIWVEWLSLIKPLRAREPEGMWNLLQMVREMFARGDENAVALLRTITDECLSNVQVLLWWYITKLGQSGKWTQQNPIKTTGSSQVVTQYNCSQLCDEVVILWKCAALNPRAGNRYRTQLGAYLQEYHRTAVNRLRSAISMAPTTDDIGPKTDMTVLSNHQTSLVLQGIINNDDYQPLSSQNMRFDVDSFPAFYPAIQMCNYLCESSYNFGLPTDAFFFISAPNLTTAYKMVPPEEKPKKKKKKTKKRKHRDYDDDNGEGPSRSNNAFFNQWRMIENVPEDSQGRESTESGQESDVQKPSTSRNIKVRNIQTAESDVNDLLANSYGSLDTIEMRFFPIEAFATHGYRAEAIEHCIKQIDYLTESLSEQANDLILLRLSDSKTSSVSSSQDSDDLPSFTIDRDAEVIKSRQFVKTLEKVLYIIKVLQASPHLNCLVFTKALKALAVTKFPVVTKFQQMDLYFLEAEFVAVLEKLYTTTLLEAKQIKQVRRAAQVLIDLQSGYHEDIPSIQLAHFIFTVLCSDEALATYSGLPGPNTVRYENRQHNMSTDGELALDVALRMLGTVPQWQEPVYLFHSQTLRRLKNDLSLLLLLSYKDDQEKLGLIMDKILDPNLHRMYTDHASNAAYFLEKSPQYKKYHTNKERPVFPYQSIRERYDSESIPFDIEHHFDELEIADTSGDTEPSSAPISRGVSDEGMSEASVFSDQMPSTSTQGLSKNSVESSKTQAKLYGFVGWSDPLQKKRTKRRNNSYYQSFAITCDAQVEFLNDLSRKILTEAGGQNNNVFMMDVPNAVPHKKLQVCSLMVAIYAMGMKNRISPSWTSRTYSNSASWIGTQVHEVGAPGLELIREMWASHFTPSEVAMMSDRAFPSADPAMRYEGAKLALSVLPYSQSLNDDEIVGCLMKCKQQSKEMVLEALQALDTAQFRKVGRVKPLFCAMNFWADLSAEEEAAQPAFVVNPYAQLANIIVQNAQNAQQRPNQPFAENENAAAAAQQIQNIWAPIPQQAAPVQPAHPPARYLNPQFNDNSKLHQSQSAPQLGGPNEAVVRPDNEPSPPSTSNHLKNAFFSGIRALDQVAIGHHEDRQLYLKFGQHPPFNEDMTRLFEISKSLGLPYVASFLATAQRSVFSPFILHRFAQESVKLFPISYCTVPQPGHRQSGNPMPLMTQNVIPLVYTPGPYTNIRYASLTFASAGWITSIFTQQGYHQIIGELCEKTCDQYLQGIVNKMNSPRMNDIAEIKFFIDGAYKMIMSIPHRNSRELFNDFVRAFKKQKAFRKEIQSHVNKMLHDLFK